MAAELLAHCGVCDSDRGRHVAHGALVPAAAHEPACRAPAALAHGPLEKSTEPSEPRDLSLFSPLAREVETMAESLIEARAAAAAEARLREAGEHLWTAERLAVHMRKKRGSSRIFVVSNREPYMHVRQGRETVCVVPPSGLVTAIEPVLRACDGVWVAHGSGERGCDRGGRVRPSARAARRSALHPAAGVAFRAKRRPATTTASANEGLVAACATSRIRGRSFARPTGNATSASTRSLPTRCSKRWRTAPDPVVFVQDYHFALLPRLVKDGAAGCARGDLLAHSVAQS